MEEFEQWCQERYGFHSSQLCFLTGSELREAWQASRKETPPSNKCTLTGRALDFAVAKCLGFVWAKSVCKRQGGDEKWPSGARFFIAPAHSSGLNADTPNWDGYVEADLSDPIAPAAFYTLPKYSTHYQLDSRTFDEIYQKVPASVRKDLSNRTDGTHFREGLLQAFVDAHDISIDVPKQLLEEK